MQFQGQQIQSYVSDLVKSFDEMKEKKELLRAQIINEEEEKAHIEQELQILSDRLEKTNEVILKAESDKNNLQKTISDTELTRNKIAESFKTLLSALQKENYQYSKGKK